MEISESLAALKPERILRHKALLETSKKIGFKAS